MTLLRGTNPPRWASLKDRRREAGLGAHPQLVTDYIRNLIGLVRLYPMQEHRPNLALDYGPDSQHGTANDLALGETGQVDYAYEFAGAECVACPALGITGAWAFGFLINPDMSVPSVFLGFSDAFTAVKPSSVGTTLSTSKDGVVHEFTDLVIADLTSQWVFLWHDGTDMHAALNTVESADLWTVDPDFPENLWALGAGSPEPADDPGYFTGLGSHAFWLDRALTSAEIAIIVELSGL
jgi:hypothetical protein